MYLGTATSLEIVLVHVCVPRGRLRVVPVVVPRDQADRHTGTTDTGTCRGSLSNVRHPRLLVLCLLARRHPPLARPAPHIFCQKSKIDSPESGHDIRMAWHGGLTLATSCDKSKYHHDETPASSRGSLAQNPTRHSTRKQRSFQG